MTMAYVESCRSLCLKRKVGAVIVTEEGQIISSGYNDVPDQEKSCVEQYGKCYRDLMKEKYATKYRKCPSCGKRISIYAKCHHQHCGKVMRMYYSLCPGCMKEVEHAHKCSCGSKVFEEFIPGGIETPGKLLDLCRALHAEERAFMQVMKLGGAPLKNGVIYITSYPCNLCANKIAVSGIKEVVFAEPYPMQEAKIILKNSDVSTRRFSGVKNTAYFKLFS